MSNNRIIWLDIAKGIGILLVITGHNLGFITNFPVEHRLIYSFHMPLFFLLTGYTLKAGSYRDTARRALAVAIPYLFMSLVMIPISMSFDRAANPIDLLLGILYGTGHTIDLTPLWFLSCTASALLLLATIFFVLDKTKLTPPSLPSIQAFAIGALLIIIGSFTLDSLNIHCKSAYGWGNLHTTGAFWNIDIAPTAAGFMLLGSALSHHTYRLSNQKTGLLITASLGLFTTLVGIALVTSNRYDLNFRRISPTVTATFLPILGILATITLSFAVSKYESASTVLSKLAQSGVVILWLHGGLQNKGARILLHGTVEPNSPQFWAIAFILAASIPVLIDTFIVRKVPLIRNLIYPKLKFI
jgi:fucose 4-O-acetylase-like acetyltransferase